MSDAAPVTPPVTGGGKSASGLKRFGMIFLYAWALLGISALHKSLILAESGLHERQGFAVVNALVLAKILFVSEEFGLGERYAREPLLYPILFKSAVYAMVLSACESIEGLLLGEVRGKTVAESLSDVGGGTPFGIVTTTLLLFFALLPLFSYRELGRVMGEPELHRLLFVERGRLRWAQEDRAGPPTDQRSRAGSPTPPTSTPG